MNETNKITDASNKQSSLPIILSLNVVEIKTNFLYPEKYLTQFAFFHTKLAVGRKGRPGQ